MDFNRKFTKEPNTPPKQLYFVDKMPRSILITAKTFGLPVFEPEPNNNGMLMKPLQNCIYIFKDFENNTFFHLVENTPNTWILGPTALHEMAENPALEIRTKPTYCTFMYDFIFYINCPDDFPLMRRMVRLLKWMGGRFVNEPNYSMTHMITSTSRAKGYSYCYIFGVPILTPAWVEHCWKQRRIPNFKVTSVMDKFKIKTFADLYIALKGFSSEELIHLELMARTNGGVVVTANDQRCTHLVVQKDVASHVNISDVPTHISYIVKEEWLTASLDEGRCVYEETYLCFSSKEIRKSLWAIAAAEETSEKVKKKNSLFEALLNDAQVQDQILLETAKKKSQDVQRKLAFEELYSTDKNYLYCLKQLLYIQRLATGEYHSGDAILKNAEAKSIFGNIDKLCVIHQALTDHFEDVLKNWKNDAITVQRIIDMKHELQKQYVIYSTNCELLMKSMKKKESQNKRFQTLLKNSMKTTREHPKDLLIRPIQRLGSTSLTLAKINKNTREDNPDKQVLNEAIKVIREVALFMDNSQVKAEKLEKIFEIHRLIKGCPPDLITSHREFIVDFSAQEVVSNHMNLGMQVKFFLFNDILEISKVRMKTQRLLKNHILPDSKKEKLFKHIVTLPLSTIMNVIEFEGKEEDPQNIFGFNIKDANEERTTCIFCFQYSDENYRPLNEILLMIAKELAKDDASKSPKDFMLSSVPLSTVSMASSSPNLKALDMVSDLLKNPNNKVTKNNLNINTEINHPPRKSFSCGDLTSMPSL